MNQEVDSLILELRKAKTPRSVSKTIPEGYRELKFGEIYDENCLEFWPAEVIPDNKGGFEVRPSKWVRLGDQPIWVKHCIQVGKYKIDNNNYLCKKVDIKVKKQKSVKFGHTFWGKVSEIEWRLGLWIKIDHFKFLNKHRST